MPLVSTLEAERQRQEAGGRRQEAGGRREAAVRSQVFQASLVHRVSSRTARATQKNPVLKNKKK